MEVDKEQESAAVGPGDDVADVPEAHVHPSCHDVLINLDDAETMRCRSGAMRCGAVRCGAAADDERSNDVESSNVPSARGEHFIYKDLQQGP